MILVTGGAGFIGRHLVKRLESQGEKVFVLDNNWRNPFNSIKEYADFDITIQPDLVAAFNEAEKGGEITEVIHLAYINGTKYFYEMPYEVMYVAAQGMINVIRSCSHYGVKKFTLVSSSEVCRYAPVGSDEAMPLLIPDVYTARYSYSIGKMLSEMMAIHCGLFDKLTIVRPFNIYGPGMTPGHVIPDILKQFEGQKGSSVNIKLIGSGEETRSFCYIDDFIDGLMIAREKGEHKSIYNIGVPEETKIAHLVQMIATIKGKTSCSIKQLGKLREGDLQRRRPDIFKLVALGYAPKWSLRNGLRKMINADQ